MVEKATCVFNINIYSRTAIHQTLKMLQNNNSISLQCFQIGISCFGYKENDVLKVIHLRLVCQTGEIAH